MVLPYSYFVPKSSKTPLTEDLAALGSDGYTPVSCKLQTLIGAKKGFVMNPFADKLSAYL